MFFEDYDDAALRKQLSGNRFLVRYRLWGDRETARSKAADICAEQTVEFPLSLLPPGAIAEAVVGRLEGFEREEGADSYAATISFAEEIAAGELTQFLNVIFGNISLKQGVQVTAIQAGERFLEQWGGPRFGIAGIRQRLGVPVRPPLFTALKPLGLSAKNLAVLAGQFAQGGINIIKDDHGLTDQVFAPFEERVARCAAAVREVNEKQGSRAIYAPNVTAPAERVFERALLAKKLGAGALLLSPGLAGWDAVRRLACPEIDLPLIVHPAFIGSYAINAQGITYGPLFGTLTRIAGADATIFPNAGGRFPFSAEDCAAITRASKEKLGRLPPIFPSPAGGMELKNIKEMIRRYGTDVLILIGGGLFSLGPDIIGNCRRFLEEIEAGFA
ncbi:MAG: ribulose 1,5-bisphosphate carboxylase large subunit [Peptococcaceae bacterium]|jgi:ribulose-bisphosphate carboxylase large chain|nr:ribulose 1,5-bisphosphate carboxylase large subunit [Peptococcaceae bacterium]